MREAQLYRVIKEFVTFFNGARPHQGIDQMIPGRFGISGEEKREGKIISFPVLNGLQHDYRRVA
jgi:putative transposase